MDSFWKTCVVAILRKFPKDQYEPVNKDIEEVGALFEKAGGSWEMLAKGSSGEWDVLRKICKRVLKSRIKNEK